jgi:hypothetical protein
LIARDDNERFQSKFEIISKNLNINADIVEKAEGGFTTSGGDITLKMMNVFKSLKALSGDWEDIFVILDDRHDVWFNERKELP